MFRGRHPPRVLAVTRTATYLTPHTTFDPAKRTGPSIAPRGRARSARARRLLVAALIGALALNVTAIAVPARGAQASPDAWSDAAGTAPAARLPAADDSKGAAARGLAAIPADDRTPAVLYERAIGPSTAGQTFPYDYVFDPIVATHPTDPLRIAVSYHTYRTYNTGSCSSLVGGLRITDDGGQTWHEAPAMPWAGSGRAPNWHTAIAWGPGPIADAPARLYWVDTTVPACDYSQHRLSLAYSDDEGKHWSKLHTVFATPPTLGGYPDITVDRNPASPNYGVVYAVYNWFPNASVAPHFTLLASTDFGVTWKSVEVPAVGGYASYPFKYRISYRVRTGPGGAVYVAFCQYDTTNQYDTSFGRIGFGFTRIRFDRATGTFTVRKPVMVRTDHLNSYTAAGLPAPGSTDYERLAVEWTYGLDVDQSTGRVFLALPDYTLRASAGIPRGTVALGYSDNGGRTWTWRQTPRLPTVDGRQQSATKPTLAAHDGMVFVGLHGLVDLPLRTSPAAGKATIGNYYAVSYDDGVAFTRPAAISDTRWDEEALANAHQRAGLRDRADFTADGQVFYAYGDGRMARPAPDAREGRSQIFGALISLEGPRPGSHR